ncbi:hypothetical protein LOK49_LG08G01584 [Camellia lanceoleosa]|uniref:Uncharacterized protein n=1 Tax=Camellia lanceoleosa TaxID=1840588 RepID=A0ACC0GZY8_9ERIC|nr:hypothetical protein LOK49_LG08G01584 [Camellia lanceoleosa]
MSTARLEGREVGLASSSHPPKGVISSVPSASYLRPATMRPNTKH